MERGLGIAGSKAARVALLAALAVGGPGCTKSTEGEPRLVLLRMLLPEGFRLRDVSGVDVTLSPEPAGPGLPLRPSTRVGQWNGLPAVGRTKDVDGDGRLDYVISMSGNPFRGLAADLYLQGELFQAPTPAGRELAGPLHVNVDIFDPRGVPMARGMATQDVQGLRILIGDRDRTVNVLICCPQGCEANDRSCLEVEDAGPPAPERGDVSGTIRRLPCPASDFQGDLFLVLAPNPIVGAGTSEAAYLRFPGVDLTDASRRVPFSFVTGDAGTGGVNTGAYYVVAILDHNNNLVENGYQPDRGDLMTDLVAVDVFPRRAANLDLTFTQVVEVGPCGRTNRPPVVVPGWPRTQLAGVPQCYPVDVTDPDNDPLTCTGVNLPPGARVESAPCRVCFTPARVTAPTPRVLEVRIDDGWGGVVTTRFDVTVLPNVATCNPRIPSASDHVTETTGTFRALALAPSSRSRFAFAKHVISTSSGLWYGELTNTGLFLRTYGTGGGQPLRPTVDPVFPSLVWTGRGHGVATSIFAAGTRPTAAAAFVDLDRAEPLVALGDLGAPAEATERTTMATDGRSLITLARGTSGGLDIIEWPLAGDPPTPGPVARSEVSAAAVGPATVAAGETTRVVVYTADGPTGRVIRAAVAGPGASIAARDINLFTFAPNRSWRNPRLAWSGGAFGLAFVEVDTSVSPSRPQGVRFGLLSADGRAATVSPTLVPGIDPASVTVDGASLELHFLGQEFALLFATRFPGRTIELVRIPPTGIVPAVRATLVDATALTTDFHSFASAHDGRRINLIWSENTGRGAVRFTPVSCLPPPGACPPIAFNSGTVSPFVELNANNFASQPLRGALSGGQGVLRCSMWEPLKGHGTKPSRLVLNPDCTFGGALPAAGGTDERCPQATNISDFQPAGPCFGMYGFLVRVADQCDPSQVRGIPVFVEVPGPTAGNPVTTSPPISTPRLFLAGNNYATNFRVDTQGITSPLHVAFAFGPCPFVCRTRDGGVTDGGETATTVDVVNLRVEPGARTEAVFDLVTQAHDPIEGDLQIYPHPGFATYEVRVDHNPDGGARLFDHRFHLDILELP